MNKNNTWHPCVKSHNFSPLKVKKAKGSYIYLDNGDPLIDATSSWWCKNLGHNHPRLKNALLKQAKKFEHVIFANTTNDTIIKLSAKLANMTKSLKKVFYASDGSSAVEIAIKMGVHAQKIVGEINRTKIIALRNSYHGETGLALSVTNIDLYRTPYKEILLPIDFIQNIPYLNSKTDKKWSNCPEEWAKTLDQLNKYKDELAAIIVEPIVQGAGGMRIYSKEFLKKLRIWTQKNNIYLIADEIMTGFGRTGLPFAFQYSNIEPDIVCVAKGLTSGYLPMSAVLTTDKIYETFYNTSSNNSFLHSHTHSGNALAAAVALETLNILEDGKIYSNISKIEPLLYELMLEVKQKTKKLVNIRHIGAIIAADLSLNKKQIDLQYGQKIFQKAAKLGALMRPLGNTIYWLPPLNIKEDTLIKLKDITIKAINKVIN